MFGGEPVGQRTGLVVLAIATALVIPASASAKTYKVTRTGDPAPGKCKPTDCSLREAIQAANETAARDTVKLPSGKRYKLGRTNQPLADEDDNLRGDLDVSGRLDLLHPGKGKATIDSNGVDRALHVLFEADLTLRNISVTGSADMAAPVDGGGGILSFGDLRLIRSSVIGNEAEGGGGIDAAYGRLTIDHSVIAANRTTESTGAGIYAYNTDVLVTRSVVKGNRSGNAGGGITASTGSDLRINRSTISGNRAEAGSTGVYTYEADGRISQSTISGNRGGGDGGGLDVSGGLNKTVSVVNSTIAGNRSSTGGAGVSVWGSNNLVVLRSTTIARNVAGSGSGSGVESESGGQLSVVNSLIALNRVGSSIDDCGGSADSDGGNLLTTNGCTGFEIGGGDFFTASPKIGPLANNGGLTKTVALQQGSPALRRAVKPAAPRRDQRGVKRDSKPDIGAFER